MKVAVTGAAGFLGTNLIDRLVEHGHEVTAIDRVRPDHARADGVTWVLGDVLDSDSMTGALDGAEIVYHLVAMITLAQSDDLVHAILTGGGTVDYVVYDGEGHGFRDPVNVRDEYARTEAFLAGIVPTRSG